MQDKGVVLVTGAAKRIGRVIALRLYQSGYRDVEERLGSLYGLVNNAARFRRRDPLQLTEADWDFIHNVNLKATFFCCQQGALLMKKTGAGRIVNIGSLGGLRPWEMYAH